MRIIDADKLRESLLNLMRANKYNKQENRNKGLLQALIEVDEQPTVDFQHNESVN